MEKNVVRKSAYKGEVVKCANCGAILDSLDVLCPQCGFETEVVEKDIINDFVGIFKSSASVEDKINFVKNFPIFVLNGVKP